MRVNIIGAGLSGLSAAITLAKENISSNLISAQPSERAQSVLAEGGINGALDTMGENDNYSEHIKDTLKAGCFIADEKAVDGLCKSAPEILNRLFELGVPFNMEDGHIIQRNFGGQKKKRTAFAKSSTGKALMNALIDEARKYETKGIIRRFSHHEFELLDVKNGSVCEGVFIKDSFAEKILYFEGPVIICTGGLNGLFPGMTTGTCANTGRACARLFAQGVRFSNLEMIQYHPTTFAVAGKRCLISEAARGEGGRLFVMKDGTPCFFMEEKYPELGNLMPRDVVSREIYFAMRENASETDDPAAGESTGRKKNKRKSADSYEMCRQNQVYLEMRHLSDKVWKEKLPDLRQEIIHYLGMDPEKEPIPVEPGIHYFMGGIDVDINHKTNYENLYAAGECTSQYHGANRLGGNSTLGAIYGGITAAKSIIDTKCSYACNEKKPNVKDENTPYIVSERKPLDCEDGNFNNILGKSLIKGLGIVRNKELTDSALKELKVIEDETELSFSQKAAVSLAKAMLLCADLRKESRGAHFREDYPKTDESYKAMTTACFDEKTEKICIGFKAV